MKTIVGFVLALLGVMILAWGMGWLDKGSSTVSAQNYQEQWRDAYDNYTSLEATAKNVCRARKNESASTDENSKMQLMAQRTAYEQNYERIAANYNAAMADAFRAKLVRPGDLPTRAPLLEDLLAEGGC